MPRGRFCPTMITIGQNADLLMNDIHNNPSFSLDNTDPRLSNLSNAIIDLLVRGQEDNLSHEKIQQINDEIPEILKLLEESLNNRQLSQELRSNLSTAISNVLMSIFLDC